MPFPLAAALTAAPSIIGLLGSLFGKGKGKKTEYQALQTPQAQQMQAALAQYIMGGMQRGATPYGGPLTAASISGNPLNILYSKFLGRGYKKPGLRSYGQYMPRQTPVTPAQRGFRGTVQGPRAFYIEPGMRERVNIQPTRGFRGRGQWPGAQQMPAMAPRLRDVIGQMPWPGAQQMPMMAPTPPYGRQIIGPGGMNPSIVAREPVGGWGQYSPQIGGQIPIGGGQIPLPPGAIGGGEAIPDWRRTLPPNLPPGVAEAQDRYFPSPNLPPGVIGGGEAIPSWRRTLPPNWQQMMAGAQGRYSPYSTGNIPGAIPFGVPLRM